MNIMNHIACGALALGLTVPVAAASKSEQYFKGVFGQDSAVDLAHPKKEGKTLPVGGANIRAIVQTGKYIVGVTAPQYPNKSPCIFRFDVQKGALEDFTDFNTLKKPGVVPSHALVAGDSGLAYAGTVGNGQTGELLEINSTGAAVAVKTLGKIRDKEGVFTVAISPDKKTLYGILYPSNAFFAYDFAKRTAAVFDETVFDAVTRDMISQVHSGEEEPYCKALGIDVSGKVYGSTGQGMLFRFDPVAKKIEMLNLQLPYIPWRVHTNRVESWVNGPDGMLYGGTSIDGFLFKLDPKTLMLVNLGKPNSAGNLKSMVIIDNTIYGLVGEGAHFPQMFSYNLKSGGFDVLGLISISIPMARTRYTAYAAKSILRLPDGRVVISEEDLLPSLIFMKL